MKNEKDRGHLVGTVADEKQGEVTVSEAILSNYAGTYMAGPLGHIRVTVDHGHLAFNLPGGGGQLLAFAQSEEDFILPALGGGVEVRERRARRGRVSSDHVGRRGHQSTAACPITREESIDARDQYEFR